MYDEQTIQRFIELRAHGRTYDEIHADLGVSKPTLVKWSHKHQFEINNLKAIELEALAGRWLAPVSDRVNALGAQLRQVEAELAKRAPADLTTAQLYTLARNLRRQIQQATGSVQFTIPVKDIPSKDYHDQVQDWQG